MIDTAHSRATVSDAIANMSIFDMLGVQGTEEEKEAFLTQVQDVIWQDVVENDLAPLLNEAEITQVETMLNDAQKTDDEKRDYLFGLIIDKVPDAESVLLTRTMELKSDLLHERLHGMMEFFKNDAAATAKLQEAHTHIDAQRHEEAVKLLNELSSRV